MQGQIRRDKTWIENLEHMLTGLVEATFEGDLVVG